MFGVLVRKCSVVGQRSGVESENGFPLKSVKIFATAGLDG